MAKFNPNKYGSSYGDLPPKKQPGTPVVKEKTYVNKGSYVHKVYSPPPPPEGFLDVLYEEKRRIKQLVEALEIDETSLYVNHPGADGPITTVHLTIWATHTLTGIPLWSLTDERLEYHLTRIERQFFDWQLLLDSELAGPASKSVSDTPICNFNKSFGLLVHEGRRRQLAIPYLYWYNALRYVVTS